MTSRPQNYRKIDMQFLELSGNGTKDPTIMGKSTIGQGDPRIIGKSTIDPRIMGKSTI